MNSAFKSEVDSLFGHLPPLLQFLAVVMLVFLLAFGADALLQKVVELFLAGVVEQDAFFYSAVRQQDAFAQNILALIKLVSFLAVALGFVVTMAVVYTRFFRRTSLVPPPRPEPGRLLKATLLSARGIATVTFIFLAVTAIYELLLRIVGNQPPFFLLAALISTAMYVLVLAYVLFDYTQEFKALGRGR